MFQLIRYLKGYEKESIIGPLFKLFEACLELCVPLIMASMIDIGIHTQNTAYILKMGGLLVLMGVLGLICSMVAQYFAAKAAFGFGTALRRTMFEHINHLTYKELDSIGTATLINRLIPDINQVQSGVNLTLRLFLRSPFIVLGSLILAFFLDVQLALIFVIITPLLALVIWGIMKATMPIYKKAQKQLDKIALLLRENLSGVRVIRAFSRQKQEVEQFADSSNELCDTQLHAGKFSALLNPLTYVLVNLGILALLYQGAFAVDSGRISQGNLVAFINYMSQILLALIALSNLIVSITKSFACANRINEILDTSPSFESPKATPALDKTKPCVEFRSVSFGYGGTPALQNISFSALAGQTIGIIGGTGCGKSTLVNLIPRFYTHNSGEILIHGIPLEQWNLTDLRQQIGIAAQKNILFSGTIRSNLCLKKPNATDTELWHALKIAQAAEFVSKLEKTLDSPVLQGGTNFSGGQRQRLTIARALVGNPSILIFDDSTSALDYTTDAKLRQALTEKTQNGKTIFLVSQRIMCVKNADLILVLENGALAGCGTHEELSKHCSIYQEICLSQLKQKEDALQ